MPPNPETSPNPNPNPNQGAIFLVLSPNTKTNPNFDPNPNPNRGSIFLGGQLSGYRFYGWKLLMVSHHPAKFDGYRHCGSGDIMFLVAKEKNSRYSRFNSPLLFNFQRTWIETTRHIILLTPILFTRA